MARLVEHTHPGGGDVLIWAAIGVVLVVVVLKLVGAEVAVVGHAVAVVVGAYGSGLRDGREGRAPSEPGHRAHVGGADPAGHARAETHLNPKLTHRPHPGAHEHLRRGRADGAAADKPLAGELHRAVRPVGQQEARPSGPVQAGAEHEAIGEELA